MCTPSNAFLSHAWVGAYLSLLHIHEITQASIPCLGLSGSAALPPACCSGTVQTPKVWNLPRDGWIPHRDLAPSQASVTKAWVSRPLFSCRHPVSPQLQLGFCSTCCQKMISILSVVFHHELMWSLLWFLVWGAVALLCSVQDVELLKQSCHLRKSFFFSPFPFVLAEINRSRAAQRGVCANLAAALAFFILGLTSLGLQKTSCSPLVWPPQASSFRAISACKLRRS